MIYNSIAIIGKNEAMFKYYINIPFHCFTQYYKNKNRSYEIVLFHANRSIFLCALYKKCEVEEHDPGAGIHLMISSSRNRFAVHRLVRLLSSDKKILLRRYNLHAHFFWNSVMGLGPSSRTMLTTSVTTAPHFAPSDAETKVILKRRSSRPMLFIKRLTMNIRFAAL